jgi:HSP20 family protein
MSLRRSGNLFPSMPIFDDFLSRELFNWGNDNHSATSTTVPSVNIRETANNYEIEVAAPGMDKKDFNVTLENNLLTISCAIEPNSEKADWKYSLREFSYQSFVRTFQLQKDVVDEDNIQAKYENGLLLLMIPKKEAVKQKCPRMIEIA